MALPRGATKEIEPRVIADPEVVRGEILAARQAGRRVGFVPTMGSLHAGHVSLVDRAADACDEVAVSIFVNPTQFGPGEDFERYPRDLTADLAMLAGQNVRWVYAPAAETIYPLGHATRIVVDGPARRFEGEARRSHFSGVATVVCRLFHDVPADVAYFGAKDWQQTIVVKRLVADLGLPIEIIVCPTVREPDGLAMSSRNNFLTADQRKTAAGLYATLKYTVEQILMGNREFRQLESGAALALSQLGIRPDYLAICNAETLALATAADSKLVLLAAGFVDSIRLIDNLTVEL